VKLGLVDKTPAMKVYTMWWMDEVFEFRLSISTTIPAKTKEAFATLIGTFKKLFEDGVLEVRDEAIDKLGKFKKWLDTATFNQLT
jgi:hypothetical protein